MLDMGIHLFGLVLRILNIKAQLRVTFGNVDMDHVALFTDYRIKKKTHMK